MAEDKLMKKHLDLFYTLLQLGKSTTGPLSTKSGIPTSHIYQLLFELEELGLVSKSIENKRTYFSPTSIDALKRVIQKEKNELDDIVSKAQELQVKSPRDEGQIRIFNGIRAIKGMWDILNGQLHKDSEVKFYTARQEAYEILIGFYDEHHKIQQKKKVKEKMIFDSSDPEAKRRKDKLTEIKYLKLNNKVEWGIIDDHAFFQYVVSKEPIGILISDALLVETLNQVFDQLWSLAKR
jgi:sugar-specific transcriptional regulator TrmB